MECIQILRSKGSFGGKKFWSRVFIFLLTHKSQDRSIILIWLKIYSVNSTTFIIMAAPDGGEGVIMFVYLGGEQEAPFDVTLMSSSLDPSKLFLRGHSTDVDRWCLWKRMMA